MNSFLISIQVLHLFFIILHFHYTVKVGQVWVYRTKPVNAYTCLLFFKLHIIVYLRMETYIFQKSPSAFKSDYIFGNKLIFEILKTFFFHATYKKNVFQVASKREITNNAISQAIRRLKKIVYLHTCTFLWLFIYALPTSTVLNNTQQRWNYFLLTTE